MTEHAPMKPFYALVNTVTGERTFSFSQDEIERVNRMYASDLTNGTHRIVRCVEKVAQGERRSPSVSLMEAMKQLDRALFAEFGEPPIPQPEPAPVEKRTQVARPETKTFSVTLGMDELVDLVRRSIHPPIPKPEPAPASPDLVSELRALRDCLPKAKMIHTQRVKHAIDAILAKAGV